MEVWKEIEGFEGLYEVSTEGRVRGIDRYVKSSNGGLNLWKGKELKQCLRNGYKAVHLCKDGKHKSYYVHRLVAIAFIDNPDNLPQINHKNENRTDNRIENLEWCSAFYNINYGDRTEKAISTRSARHIYKYPELKGLTREEYKKQYRLLQWKNY
jgi:hypothetical protein